MKTKQSASSFAPFEMMVTLSREDAPHLYDDLAQLPRGRRRVSRLRSLASHGLMVEMFRVILAEQPAKRPAHANPPPTSSPQLSSLLRSMDLSGDLDDEVERR